MPSRFLSISCSICVLILGVLTTSCSDPGEYEDRDAGVTGDTNDGAEGTDSSAEDVLDAADGAQGDTQDTGVADASDTEDEPDVGPCGQTCAEPTPVCDEDAGECVACLEDTDCPTSAAHCDTEANACVECTDDAHCGNVCDIDAGTCVECVEHDDCTDPAASSCADDNTCEGCKSDDQCAHFGDTTLCDISGSAGACVECTPDDDSACSAKSCDAALLTCTSTDKGSVGTCGRCKADSECAADHRCVPMEFDGADLADGFCLKLVSAGCSRPYGSVVLSRESLSGAEADDYCGLVESLTSCAAILDISSDKACPSGADECGIPGTDDGRCETVGAFSNRCTYSCSSDAQCLDGYSCGGDSGNKYCGGS